MKTQHEPTIQFSGYPLNIVETKPKFNRVELKVVKSLSDTQNLSPRNIMVNDPTNWDIDWFNSYE
jgi:hypothetical protein